MADLPPHPDPPLDPAATHLPITTTTRTLIRFHKVGVEAMYFGRDARNRCDAPRAEYGVLYAGADEYCAFIETVGWNTGIRIVTMRALRQMAIARIDTRRPLLLVDLVGPGHLARIGADARLWSGEHTVAQRWSKWFWDHPVRLDGILFPARHDPSRHACAIFDRAAVDLTSTPAGILASAEHAKLVGAMLDQYGFGLVDD